MKDNQFMTVEMVLPSSQNEDKLQVSMLNIIHRFHESVASEVLGNKKLWEKVQPLDAISMIATNYIVHSMKMCLRDFKNPKERIKVLNHVLEEINELTTKLWTLIETQTADMDSCN